MDNQNPQTYWSRRPYHDARKGSRVPVSVIVTGGLAASAFAFFLTPQPFSEPSNDRIFSEGLRVQLPRTSPAFAAMEDSLLPERVPTYATIQASNEPMTVELLEAGQAAATWIAEQITRDNRREALLLAQKRAAETSERDRLERERLLQLASAAKPPEVGKSAPKVLAQVEASTVTQGLSSRHVYQHPARTIRLSDLKMSREDLARELMVPMVASVDPQGAQEMMVADQASSGRYYVTDRRDKREPRLGGLVPPRSHESDRRPTADRKPATRHFDGVNPYSFSGPETVEVDDVAARRGPLHQLVVSGALEFAGGLAFANTTDRVVVYRENEDQPFESAAVWLREGRYEIFVEQAVGRLVAELRTPHGDILGRGTFELDRLPTPAQNQYRVDRVNLKVLPAPQGITGQVVSAYSYDQKTFPIKGAQLAFSELPIDIVSKTDGRFEEPALLEGSSVMIKASREGHWGTLAFASAGVHNSLHLYPNKMIEAFTNLAARPSVKNAAVIWGRVTRGGEPIAGAQVELMTTEEETKPVYFNAMMIPDPSLTATSANGLYAFYPVPAGAHAVQATSGGVAVGDPRLFPTEPQTVSHVDLDIAPNRKAQVKVFDAFRTDWPLAAELQFPGSVKAVRVDRGGVGSLHYASGSGPMVVDVTAGPSYERIRLSVNRGVRSIYAPMIQTQWVERIQAAMRLNKEPHTGKIIGFIQGMAPYSIAMDDAGLRPDSRVIYFDSRGEIIAGSRGVPGGGFILFNVPEGFHTVTVRPEGLQKAFATTVLVESSATNIVNYWIR